ncbi:MAG: hypothetical protein A2X52_11960 [Candidatus Rokubacteria bacterium GWC2_70_16]|nr:MAG: hypothetical protein A2X52_11960 [Candidatus Rokubacteria bacterium GWC2_70_16]
MSKKKAALPAPRRGRRRWVVGGVLAAIVAGAGTFWWQSESLGTYSGTPRLVVDREVVELGTLPFEAPVRVVFTLTNAGDGALKIAEVPRVKAVVGC